jgi:ABC-type lipoprotein export system ATPase subunit
MQEPSEIHTIKDEINITLTSNEKAAQNDSDSFQAKIAEHEMRDNIDPFDVDDKNWCFEKAVLAAIERAEQGDSGPIIPSVSLSFKNLKAYGDDAGIVAQTDAGSLFTDLFRFLFRPRRKMLEKEIIYNIDGLVQEGEMLLVLGGPRSGCTTLLKMLSGHREGYRRWGGQVCYCGIPLDDMLPRFRGLIIYNGEVDHHYSHLTVAQTLTFAASTKTPHRRFNGMSRKHYIRMARDVLGAVFGLTHNFNTKVGNDYVRGLSGGEKRRLAIAETVCLPMCHISHIC